MCAKLLTAVELPTDFREFTELRLTNIEHGLGYFGDEPYVIFGYCPGGGEVIWKDGAASGFGAGGWKIFLEDIIPLALCHGIDLGSISSAGTHVLLLDRVRRTIYSASRKSAEEFRSRVYGLPMPRRTCLCGQMDCSACVANSCGHAHY